MPVSYTHVFYLSGLLFCIGLLGYGFSRNRRSHLVFLGILLQTPIVMFAGFSSTYQSSQGEVYAILVLLAATTLIFIYSLLAAGKKTPCNTKPADNTLPDRDLTI